MRSLTVFWALCVLGACAKSPSSASPPADCAQVADSFVSFRMGNYAPKAERDAASAQLLDACKDAHVSTGEAKCVAAMKSEWEAKQCVPAMFPELAPSSDDDVEADCAKISDKLRSLLSTQKGMEKQWADKILTVQKQACVEDKWPQPVRQCMLTTPFDQLKAGNDCGLPPPMMKKMQDRITAAMSSGIKPG